jgi:hypothetical protein
MRYNRFGNTGLVVSAAIARLELTAGELAELDRLGALPREYPGWMVERRGISAGRTSPRREAK